jgi:hypothetical protein
MSREPRRVTIDIPDIGEALDQQGDVLSDMLTVLEEIRDHLVAIHDNTDKITTP